jgi:hypothetical protein
LDCPFPWATSLRRSNESKAYSETTMAKRKPTKADLEARAQMRRNADRLRELADKGLADLERKRRGPVRRPGLTNAEWLRELAEQGKRDLDARGQTER